MTLEQYVSVGDKIHFVNAETKTRDLAAIKELIQASLEFIKGQLIKKNLNGCAMIVNTPG